MTPPPDIAPALTELREIAEAFKREGWEADVDLAEAFAEALFDVGRALHSEPALRESPAWRDFHDAVAPKVASNAGGFVRYAHGIDARLHETFSYGGEWLIVCRRRSSLAFLTELFGTSLEEWRDDLESADLEEVLRYRCGTDGYVAPDDVPGGIPRSHWWWRCPSPD